jgi:hypothetical protein
MVTTGGGDAPTDGAARAPNHGRQTDPLLLRIVRFGTRLTRPLAGRRFFPMWALLRHRGRKSGREFAVPVGVRATADAYFIALPFGKRTQWGAQRGGCRRVHAALARHRIRHGGSDDRPSRGGSLRVPTGPAVDDARGGRAPVLRLRRVDHLVG